MTLKELNTKLFLKVNALQGKNRWADAFGRAGAEWAIIAMFAWYVSSVYIAYDGNRLAILWPVLFLGAAWALAWIINLAAGAIVREPRPMVTDPQVKVLFKPLSNWKSFPSDHAMSAWLIFFLALIFQIPAAWALLPLALWVCWGRVYSGVHYPGDILAGAAVAAIVAFAVKVVLFQVL